MSYFALIFLAFVFHFLFIVPFFAMCRQHQCPSPIFRSHDGQNNHSNSTIHSKHQPTHNPFHFYALTQDCQFVIARPDQLNKLSSLRILAHSKECHPSRVQLIWSMESAQPSLQLLYKRNAHEICILPVEMPNPLSIHGPELFIYSLRSALIRFAKCSRPNAPPNSSNSRPLIVDPQLMFPDSLYSDLFYQISTQSSNVQNWTVDQLQISARGHLHPIQQFRIQSMQNGISPEDLMLSIDPQRKRIFAVPKNLGKKNAEIEWTCPFDLIFRPKQTKFHRFNLLPINTESSFDESIMTGFSVDRHIAIFTMEKNQNTELFLSKLDITGKGHTAETRCVLRMPFSAKFGVISELTLNELAQKGPLPSIGNKFGKANGLMEHSRTTTKSPIWHKYTKLSLMATTARQNRQTSKMDENKSTQQYFWHRSTTTMPSIKSTSTEQNEVESADDGEAVEAWNEEYDGEEEVEKNEQEEEEDIGGKEEQERILPLANEDVAEKTQAPAQMISDENGAAQQKSGQIANRLNLATFLAIALLIGINWI